MKVQKKVEKGSKKGSKLGGHSQKLTKVEEEIYTLMTRDYLTPLQISLRRQTSVSAVYKLIKKIKNKGHFFKEVHRVENSDPTFEPLYKKIRLHGVHISCGILQKGSQYEFMRDKSNVIYRKDCIIKLHRKSIEVMGSSGLSFFGETADKVTAKCMDFFTRTLVYLESELKVSLIKFRYQNIKVVSAHYAHLNSGIAQKVVDARDKVRIYSREDGKLWFTIDNSFNFNEAETLHPDTAQDDMSDVVEPFLNKLREDPLILKRIENTLELMAQRNLETATALDVVATFMKPADVVDPVSVMPKRMWYHG